MARGREVGCSRRIRVIGGVIFSPALRNTAKFGQKVCASIFATQTSSPCRWISKTANRLVVVERSIPFPATASNGSSFSATRKLTGDPVCSCSSTDSRTTFIACRIYGLLALPRKLAASINSYGLDFCLVKLIRKDDRQIPPFRIGNEFCLLRSPNLISRIFIESEIRTFCNISDRR